MVNLFPEICKQCFVIFYVLAAFAGNGQHKDFTWPLPENWVEEHIPFPLKFAPELDYPGEEVIHFMPGWKGTGPEEGERWSYTFVWHLDSLIFFDAGRITRDLELYFEGLQDWVQKNSKIDCQVKMKPQVTITGAGGKGDEKFTGTADFLDVFFSMKPIRLNLKISLITDARQGKTILLFGLSPRPFQDTVWKELEHHLAEFSCSFSLNSNH